MVLGDKIYVENMGLLKVELFWLQMVIICAFERNIEVALLNTIGQEHFAYVSHNIVYLGWLLVIRKCP